MYIQPKLLQTVQESLDYTLTLPQHQGLTCHVQEPMQTLK